MKAGDLVRYVGEGWNDDVTGVVAAAPVPNDQLRDGELSWVTVIWSLGHGPHYDEVPLMDLEIVNESR